MNGDDPALELFPEHVGDSERSGIELAGRWNLSERFAVAGSYTYTDSHEPSPTGEDVSELRRPRHAGNLSFDFTSLNEKWQATLAADYGGTRNDLFFPPFPDPSQVVTLDAYWLVDLAVHYRVTPAVTLFARGTNLLDDEYEQVYGYRTLGRAGYVGVRTSFGR